LGHLSAKFETYVKKRGTGQESSTHADRKENVFALSIDRKRRRILDTTILAMPNYYVKSLALTDSCELRQSKYLNNLIEQDHRFIKRLVKPGMGFFSLETAWNTLQGYEGMNTIRKGQVHGVAKGNITGQISFLASLFGLVA